MKYLIAGLGNIGPEYELTRHNIGFLVLDEMARQKNAPFDHVRHAFACPLKHKGKIVHLIKPTTYMNLSGKAVNYWLSGLKIPKENLLVITDDLALPYGKIRIKGKGSSGGHNGLKNIEELTGGQNYARLKFGVGNSFAKGKQTDYVLSPFSKAETDALAPNINRAAEAAFSFCTTGLDKTMNLYNQ